MTDQELNERAAELLGGKITALGWLNWNDDRHSIADWSPATKIEHAWIVQQFACERNRSAFTRQLAWLNPDVDIVGPAETDEWLATAPPRARTEAAVQVLTNCPTGIATGE